MGYVYTGTTSITDCFSGQTPVKQIYSGITLIWEKEPEYGEYLTFYASSGNATVTLAKSGQPTSASLVWRNGDSGSWQTYNIGDTITITEDNSIQMKAASSASSFSTDESNYYYFSTTGDVIVGGDIMYLIDPRGERRDVPSYCFYDLFIGTSIVSTSKLNLYSTDVGYAGYRGMFASCSRLEDGPNIFAETASSYAFANMFDSCYSMLYGPSIGIGTAAPYCCYRMFRGCYGLMECPGIYTTKMAGNCFEEMFIDCNGLTSLPVLTGITDLCAECFKGMFNGCSGIYASNLSTHDDSYLFLSVDPSTPEPANWSSYMLSGTSGDFTGNPVVGTGYYCYQPQRSDDGVKFTANTANATVTLNQEGSPSPVDLSYSTDGINWQSYTIGQTITLASIGKYVQIKCNQSSMTFSEDENNYYYFSTTGDLRLEGNVEFLIDPSGSGTLNDYIFYRLFAGTTVTDASHLELTATSLYNQCYQAMFGMCTGLTAAPYLPATQMAFGCYQGMFNGCSSLTMAPELPATTLADYCYQGMFAGCTSLSVTDNPTIGGTIFLNVPAGTTSPTGWSDMMLNGTGGTFISDPVVGTPYYYYDMLPEPNGVIFTAVDDSATIALTSVGSPDPVTLEYCIDGGEWSAYTVGDEFMLSQNQTIAFRSAGSTTFSKSASDYYKFVTTYGWNVEGNLNDLIDTTCLVLSAPSYCFNQLFYQSTLFDASHLNLNATTVGDYIYQKMFYESTALQYGPANIAATTVGRNAFGWMFNGCSFMREGPTAILASELPIDCCYHMFENCSQLVTAPEIYASAIGDWTCYGMFWGCSQLVAGPTVLSATTIDNKSYYSMFYNCTSLTAAPVIAAPNALCGGCYQYMFSGCSHLSVTDDPEYAYGTQEFMYIPEGTISATYWNDGTFSGTGGIYKSSPEIGTHYYFYSGPVIHNDGLTFTALEDNSSIQLVQNGEGNNINLAYSTDNVNWNSYTVGDTIKLINTGDTVKFASDGSTVFSKYGSFANSYYSFNLDGKVSVSGNIMYLIDPTGKRTIYDSSYYFNRLFINQTALYDASGLILNSRSYTAYNGQEVYYSMFEGCSNLTASPVLSCGYLGDGSCDRMFAGCTSLSVTSISTHYPYSYTTFYMATHPYSIGALANNTFLSTAGDYQANPYSSVRYYCYDGSKLSSYWQPLTFIANEDNSAVRLVENGSPSTIDLVYSTDGLTWNSYTVGDTITISHANDTVQFKSNGSTWFSKDDYSNFYNFKLSGNITLAGNIQYLIDPTGTSNTAACFANIFSGNSSLVDAKLLNLPATTLANYCYSGMFAGCTNLSIAPTINNNVSSLPEGCYAGMFMNCSKLSVAINIPQEKHAGDMIMYPLSGIPTGESWGDSVFYETAGLSSTRISAGIAYYYSL